MKKLVALVGMSVLLFGCHKEQELSPIWDMQRVYAENAKKVTISNGVWGTLSFWEGNCEPSIDPNVCSYYPVKRTVLVFPYTLSTDATAFNNSPSFFDSFNTTPLAQADADENGFFQIDLPAGHYSLAVLENGKLYVNMFDGYTGLNPVTISTGTQNVNIELNYKASF